MIQLLKKILFRLLMTLIILIGALSFFMSTTPGLYTTIKIASLVLPGTIKIKHLTGRLSDQFSIGELTYQHRNTYLKINQLALKWQFSSLMHNQLPIDFLHANTIEFHDDITNPHRSIIPLDTLFTYHLPFEMKLNEVRINQLIINKEDSLQRINNIELSADLLPYALTIYPLTFDYANQQFNTALSLSSKSPKKLSGTVKLNDKLNVDNRLKGTLSFGGDLNTLQWTGELFGPASISIDGSLKNATELNQTIKWRNVKWHMNKEQWITSPLGSLKMTGKLPHLNLELISKINTSKQTDWQINGNMNGTLPWNWDFKINAFETNSSTTREGLHTLISAQGKIKDELHGIVSVTVHPGHYQMPENHALPSIQFKGGLLNASLTPDELSGKGTLSLDQDTNVHLSFRLPQFNLKKGFTRHQPMSGTLSFVLNSFDFLSDLSDEINKPKGYLNASIKGNGTLSKLVLESELNLKHVSFSLPKLGLHLNSIDLKAIGKENTWNATGTIVSDNKKLILQGTGPINNQLIGDLTIQGTNFPIAKTKEYDIAISPQLKLNFNPSNVNISGTILVPYAHILPQPFTNSVTLPEDVVYKTKEETQSTSFNTSMDIHVEMGHDVELAFKGLHALLEGSVHIKQLPQGPINANGELTVKKGEYKAYGQDLTIEQGQLLFTGGRINNPGVNLRASKSIDNTTSNFTGSNQLFDFKNNNVQNLNIGSHIKVGVEVTGRLTSPKIQLFSIPSTLSQADILSMLVLGTPASQANKSGGQLLLAAISSMNLGAGTNGAQLLEQLKNSLGFDFNIQTTNNFNQSTNQFTESTGFVVGKTLSKRLYLSYNVGLSQADPNVLTLKYLLNKFFSIQVSSSTIANGIDFLYSSNKTSKRT